MQSSGGRVRFYFTSVTGTSASRTTCRAMDQRSSSVDPMPRVPMTMLAQPCSRAYATTVDPTKPLATWLL